MLSRLHYLYSSAADVTVNDKKRYLIPTAGLYIYNLVYSYVYEPYIPISNNVTVKLTDNESNIPPYHHILNFIYNLAIFKCTLLVILRTC